MDSMESIPPAYVAWRAGSTYKVIVPAARARICRPFKEPRNRFPAWRTGTTTLYVVPARRAT